MGKENTELHAAMVAKPEMEYGELNQAIMSFVGLHPEQYTMASLALIISKESEFNRGELLDEIRAMMGTQLSLSSSRTVYVRQKRVPLRISNPHGGEMI